MGAEVLRKGLHQPGRAFSMMYADNQTGMFFMVWDCTHASMGVGALAACGESLRAEGSMVFCESSSDRRVSTGSIKCYDYPPNGTIAFDSELPPVTGDAGFSATGRPWFLDGAEYGAFWSPIRRSDFARNGFVQTYSVAVDYYDEQGARTLLGVVGAQRHEGDSCSNPTESSPIDWRDIPAVDVEPHDSTTDNNNSTTEDDAQGSALFWSLLGIGVFGLGVASYFKDFIRQRCQKYAKVHHMFKSNPTRQINFKPYRLREENTNLTADSDATKDATAASTDIVVSIGPDAPKMAPKGPSIVRVAGP